jgi:hypothetical protein
MIRRLLGAACGLALLLAPAVAHAEATTAPFLSPDYVREVTIEQAEAHHVSASWMLAVEGCESKFRYDAVSPDGQDVGPWQIHAGGAVEARLRADGFGPDREDVWATTTVAAELFSEGQDRQWSCAWTLRGLRPPWW